MAITVTGRYTQTGKATIPAPIVSGGTLAIVGGGGNPSDLASIETFDISTLGGTTSFGDLTLARRNMGAISNAVRGVFTGGNQTITGVNVIDFVIISSAAAATDFGDLTRERRFTDAVSNGTSDTGRIIAGGSGPSGSNDTITISTEANATGFGGLTGVREFHTTASNGVNDRGLVAGGRTSGAAMVNTIQYITISNGSGSTDWGDLSSKKRFTGGTSNDTNNKAVFAGGLTDAAATISVIDKREISTGVTASFFGDLLSIHYGMAACSSGVNERGVFCGGFDGVYLNVMEYVTISSDGNSIDFGDLTTIRFETEATSDGQA